MSVSDILLTKDPTRLGIYDARITFTIGGITNRSCFEIY